MKALYVDWLLKGQHFLSISASVEAFRMVSPTHIMLEFHLLRKNIYFTSSVMGSIFKTSRDEIYTNMSTGDGISYHYLVGMPIIRLHDASSSLTDFFVILLHEGGWSRILLASFFWMLLHPLWVFLCRSLAVSRVATFPPKIIAGDVVKICFGGLVVVFVFTIIIPSFSILCKHNLVNDTFRLGLHTRVILMLVILK